MQFIYFLLQHPTFFYTFTTVIGLCVGSFLNVLIYRLPRMLNSEWQAQCRELLQVGNKPATEEVFNLKMPRSHCPHCQHPISIFANIPLLSYMWLKGQCAHCHKAISWRYPLVELITGCLSLYLAWHYGLSEPFFAALVLTWSLVALTAIDMEHQLLPDNITLPLLWLGLFFSVFNVFVDPRTAIIGALAGYLSLWSVAWFFKRVTGKEGMGYGDFKLLAVFGAWFGFKPLLFIVLLSSLLGAVVGIALLLVKKTQRYQPIPFGPFLAIAGWIAMLWSDKLIDIYLHWLR